MKSLGLTPNQIQVAAMVDVSASELFMAVGFDERRLIDHRTGWTWPIMHDAGVTLGDEILTLMQPSALNPDGIHQREVETLQTEFIEADNKIVDYLTHLRWPMREYRPFEHVTVRLGKKALRHALAQWCARDQ